MTKKIKVMVVDDSALYRALLTQIIESHPEFTVVAAAEDPYDARDKIKRYNPDVLTLDVEMPRMNGLQFLKNLMRLRPMPVIMISTLTQHGADVTMSALEFGAVDYLPKPELDQSSQMVDAHYRQQVREKLLIAAQANLTATSHPSTMSNTQPTSENVGHGFSLIAIGASTGGTEAIRYILEQLPRGMPPVVVTQHISAHFSASFAKRLNDVCLLEVIEIPEGTVELCADHVYIASGDSHMIVHERKGRLFAKRDNQPPVNRHRPSVDVMFSSVAEAVGSQALGLVLTGMGSDGAQGLMAMHKAQAVTAAQDEASSVVWGMPRVAIELGAAQHILSLKQVIPFLVKGPKQQEGEVLCQTSS